MSNASDALQDLYQSLILKHHKNPINASIPKDFTHEKEGKNPLCGDRIHLFAKIEGNEIRSVHYECEGCALSGASASILAEQIQNIALKDAQDLCERLLENLEDNRPIPNTETTQNLVALNGVLAFPARKRCVTLPWETLLQILQAE